MFIYNLNANILVCSVKPFQQSTYPGKPTTAVSAAEVGPLQAPPPPPWDGRAIATHKLRLVEFSAFMEQHRDTDNTVHIIHSLITCNASENYMKQILFFSARQTYITINEHTFRGNNWILERFGDVCRNNNNKVRTE